MALTPEQAFKQAYDSTDSSIATKVAVKLKQYFPMINAGYGGNLALPADEEEQNQFFFDKAKSLVHRGYFSVQEKTGENVTISIDDLDERFSDQVGGSLKSMLPSGDKIQRAVAESVSENTGTIGFLGGATVMNALAGLIQWVFSGFAGGFDGLKKTIAQVTADKIESSLERRLKDLSLQPDMASILGSEQIGEITGAVRYSVLEASGYAEGEPPASINLTDVKLGDIDQAAREKIRAQVYNQVHDTVDKGLHDAIEASKQDVKDGKEGGLWAWGKGRLFAAADAIGLERQVASVAHWWDKSSPLIPTEAEIKLLARTTARSVSDTAVDIEQHQGNHAAIMEATRKNLTHDLKTLKASGRLPSVTDDAQLTKLVDQTVSGVEEQLAALSGKDGSDMLAAANDAVAEQRSTIGQPSPAGPNGEFVGAAGSTPAQTHEPLDQNKARS